MMIIGIALFGFLLLAVFGANAIRALLKGLVVTAIVIGGIIAVFAAADRISSPHPAVVAERPAAIITLPPGGNPYAEPPTTLALTVGLVVFALMVTGFPITMMLLSIGQPLPRYKDSLPEGHPGRDRLRDRPRLGHY